MTSFPALVTAALFAVPALTTPAAAFAPAIVAPSPVAGPVRGTVPDRIEITTEDKQKLVGSYWAPKDQRGAAPAAVLVHNAGGTRNDLVEIAERLQKQGFAVLAIDLRGHGESRGELPAWEELTEDAKSRTWTFALRDVKAAIGWISKRDGVHASNVSLLGDRAGSALVTRYATRDENIRSIVLLDPQIEQYGFNVSKDIAQLAGLPTYIAVSKESQSKAQTIADDGEKAAGDKFVEVAVFKGVAIAPVVDKSMIAGIAKFMSDKAQPSRAGR
jgi:alpha-beta hydrolase superfamily lysophospholipase